MDISITIHLVAAIWVLVAGLIQLTRPKGTGFHKALGWTWLVSMLVVSISSFWIKETFGWVYGYGPIHLLSLWVIFCVFMSIKSAKVGKIKTHKRFNVGAYFGAIGAGIGALLVPGRLLHNVLFG